MGSYIGDNRSVLEERHYVRKAGTNTYWFDFRNHRVEAYRRQHGDEFCLVIYGSDDYDDAYIMPFAKVKGIFSTTSIDSRGRWIGTIQKDVLHLSPGGLAMDVSRFYNAYEYLDVEGKETLELADLESVTFHGEELDSGNLAALIASYNRVYGEIAPFRRIVISEQIARRGPISRYLKMLRGYRCQICGEAGFDQRSGAQYAETHHILELHRLVPGSYCSDNVIVVCPTCHRKLHFAHVEFTNVNDSRVRVRINGVEYEFERNVLSTT